jgi:hypothetical protein
MPKKSSTNFCQLSEIKQVSKIPEGGGGGIIETLKLMRCTGTAIYSHIRKRIEELAEVPFYLTTGDIILPDTDKQIGYLFGDDIEKVEFQVRCGTLVNFRMRVRGQSWDNTIIPEMTILRLYHLVADRFALLPASFFLVYDSCTLPCEMVEIKSLFEELPHQLDIEVREEVVVNLITSENTSPISVPASSTIATLYPLVAVQRSTPPSSFHLSPDNFHILSSDMELSIILFIKQTEVLFYLMEASTTVKVVICGLDDEVPCLPLGMSHDQTIGDMWRVLDELIPECVGFEGDSLCTRRPASFSSAYTASDLNKTPLSHLSNNNMIIKVNIISKADAIFATIWYDDVPYSICAHPDLAICDMFRTILAFQDPYPFTFIGPNDEVIDISQEDWLGSIKHFLESIEVNIEMAVFQMKRRTLRRRMDTKMSEPKPVNLEEGSTKERFKLSDEEYVPEVISIFIHLLTVKN